MRENARDRERGGTATRAGVRRALRFLLTGAVLSLGLAQLGCGSASSPTGTCLPGQIATCSCVDQSLGLQTCGTTGIYGVCGPCGAGGDGGPVGDATGPVADEGGGDSGPADPCAAVRGAPESLEFSGVRYYRRLENNERYGDEPLEPAAFGDPSMSTLTGSQLREAPATRVELAGESATWTGHLAFSIDENAVFPLQLDHETFPSRLDYAGFEEQPTGFSFDNTEDDNSLKVTVEAFECDRVRGTFSGFAESVPLGSTFFELQGSFDVALDDRATP